MSITAPLLFPLFSAPAADAASASFSGEEDRNDEESTCAIAIFIVDDSKKRQKPGNTESAIQRTTHNKHKQKAEAVKKETQSPVTKAPPDNERGGKARRPKDVRGGSRRAAREFVKFVFGLRFDEEVKQRKKEEKYDRITNKQR
jgi:hypothetical protein